MLLVGVLNPVIGLSFLKGEYFMGFMMGKFLRFEFEQVLFLISIKKG
ncbi:hypothetical protein [Rossellomorea sp. BNER]|nr:hypothetical protein [Rossellomorea sp. BNER]